MKTVGKPRRLNGFSVPRRKHIELKPYKFTFYGSAAAEAVFILPLLYGRTKLQPTSKKTHIKMRVFLVIMLSGRFALKEPLPKRLRKAEKSLAKDQIRLK